MRRTRLPALASGALALALVAAACSGDDGGAAPTTAVATTVVATTAPATTAAPTTAAPTTAAPTTTTPATTVAPAPKIAAPDELGPYEVGRRTLQLESNGRTINVDVWYPVDTGTPGQPAVYSFIPGVELVSEAALAEVPVARTGGPFPLVIYSHGSGGLRYISASLTELIASHGFVVAAPDHVGNTAVETLLGTPVGFEQNVVNRLADVTGTIDRMLAENTTGGSPFEGTIDPEHVGIVGHSAGGATAFVTQSGATTSAGSVPADDRIDAIVAWAPATGRLAPEQLAAVDVPVLYIGGTKDDVTPIDPNIVVPWDAVTRRPAFRVDLTGGGHQSFTDVCRIQDYFAATPSTPAPLVQAVDGYAQDACTPELMPIERAHQLIDRYTVSFLLSQLADPEAQATSEAYLALLTTADGDDVTVQSK